VDVATPANVASDSDTRPPRTSWISARPRTRRRRRTFIGVSVGPSSRCWASGAVGAKARACAVSDGNRWSASTVRSWVAGTCGWSHYSCVGWCGVVDSRRVRARPARPEAGHRQWADSARFGHLGCPRPAPRWR